MKGIKKIVLLVLSLVACLSFCAFGFGCGGENKVEGTFSIAAVPADNELTEGSEFNLSVKCEPGNATYEKAEWSVSDESVATVSEEGKLVAVAAGRCIVSLTVDDKDCGSFVLTVLSNKVFVSEITIEHKERKTLILGESFTASVSVVPETNDDEIVWETSDSAVLTVSDEGVITACGAGEATVTVTAVNGEKSDSITVRVVEIENYYADFENVTFDENAKIIAGSNFSTSAIEEERKLIKDEFKGKSYLESENLYDAGEYHFLAFVMNDKFYEGVEYTLAVNIQLLRGVSAMGIAVCAEADISKKIATEADESEVYNAVLQNVGGLNEVRITFVCPKDTETLYLYTGEANGQNIVAFSDLSITPAFRYEEKSSAKINVYKEDFKFAVEREDGSVASFSDKDAYFYLPKYEAGNSLNSVKHENGESALVITNNYESTYTPREAAAYFAIEEGKKYSVTIVYSTVRTHNGQFIIKYIGGEQIGEVLTKGGTDLTNEEVSWEFTAAHSADGILFTFGDFIGNNELHVSLIEIREII